MTETIADFYDPHLYDLNVGHAPRVGPAYVKLIAGLPSGARVMELGCGTGDVLLPLAENGAGVIGVDNSPAMLTYLKARLQDLPPPVRDRVELAQCELPLLPDLPPVDAVVMPNDLVGNILEDDALDELLANTHRAVRSGGLVALDVSRFDVGFLASLTGDGAQLTRTHGMFAYPDDRMLRVGEQSSFDEATGIVDSTFRYELLDHSGLVERTWYRTLRMHPRRVREITAGLRLHGFAVTGVHADAFPTGPDHVLVTATAR